MFTFCQDYLFALFKCFCTILLYAAERTARNRDQAVAVQHPHPSSSLLRGKLLEPSSGTRESSSNPLVGATYSQSVVTRQVGLSGGLYPGKMGRKKPTSLHKCCGRTFGKDCIYLMVSAVLTYSSRIHKITPLKSQWKNTCEVPNTQWCIRCNRGNRGKRIKSFCGRREKNLHVKSHCIPPRRDKGPSAPETPREPCLLASQTLSWSRIGLFLCCIQR